MSHWASPQEEVDGAGLALAPLLLDEPDARILGGVLLDDRHGAVGAGAGHDDDLDDLHLVEVLVDQRRQQVADVGLLVVRRHPNAATNQFSLRPRHSRLVPCSIDKVTRRR